MTGGWDAAAAVLQTKAIAAVVNVACVICDRSYHFVIAVWRAIEENQPPVRYWEIIADNLSKADWSWGCVSAIDSNGRFVPLGAGIAQADCNGCTIRVLRP